MYWICSFFTNKLFLRLGTVDSFHARSIKEHYQSTQTKCYRNISDWQFYHKTYAHLVLRWVKKINKILQCTYNHTYIFYFLIWSYMIWYYFARSYQQYTHIWSDKDWYLHVWYDHGRGFISSIRSHVHQYAWFKIIWSIGQWWWMYRICIET